MSFESFLDDLPLIHNWEGGDNWCLGGFDRGILKEMHSFLKAHLGKGAVFLETGAGLSTITLLSSNPSKMISIAPLSDLFDRIRASCTKFDISDRALEAHVDGSEWVLPELAALNRHSEPTLDFVLIDGCHGWPTAFVDLEYCNSMLKNGGYLLIDDVHLHSLKEMARFISDNPSFILAKDLGKALIFKKTSADRHFGEWCYQPYLVKSTERYGKQPNAFSLAPAKSPIQNLFDRIQRLLAPRFPKKPA